MHSFVHLYKRIREYFFILLCNATADFGEPENTLALETGDRQIPGNTADWCARSEAWGPAATWWLRAGVSGHMVLCLDLFSYLHHPACVLREGSALLRCVPLGISEHDLLRPDEPGMMPCLLLPIAPALSCSVKPPSHCLVSGAISQLLADMTVLSLGLRPWRAGLGMVRPVPENFSAIQLCLDIPWRSTMVSAVLSHFWQNLMSDRTLARHALILGAL